LNQTKLTNQTIKQLFANFSALPGPFPHIKVTLAPVQNNPVADAKIFTLRIPGLDLNGTYGLTILDGPCLNSSRILDPTHRIQPAYNCSRTNVSSCAAGDLSGRHGYFKTSNGTLTGNFSDSVLKIFYGPYSMVHRGVLLRKLDNETNQSFMSGKAVGCAVFEAQIGPIDVYDPKVKSDAIHIMTTNLLLLTMLIYCTI